ncbi:polyketide cyclase [Aeromicrobium sp. PE09-221]|uniref:SRPBCC family protein n=1 Tax=Aeromicrobium sp. PE09-221 TaxID=1898043 RepID=UPI000B3E548A|nr:SRPBCC domain-containing protein [Aeromicrobium sp. PE09-221]OUZ07621.1 polyketide cyclase [Aeromicrobium sp. PE09-221]
MTEPEFTLTRTLDAPVERVWEAWTDPDQLARWHHPVGVSTPRETVRVDLREGGTYSYTMVADETGETYPTGGTYLTVEPPHRLVFTWGAPGDAREDQPVVSLSLSATGDGTELTLNVTGIAGNPGDDGVYDGWNEALDSLETHVDV